MLGHDGVECRHRYAHIGIATHGPVFKFIARKGKRGRPVAVGIVENDLGDLIDTEFHVHVVALLYLDISVVFELVEYGRHLRADEYGDNGRRRFVGAKAVIIACRGDRSPEDISIFVNCRDGVYEKREKLQVLPGAAARLEKVDAGVGDQRPVVVLPCTINLCEGLLVEKHLQVMPFGYFSHHVHHQHVVVGGYVYFFKKRCYLKLARRYLVVPCGHRDAQFMAFHFKLLHKGINPCGDAAEVVIVQLLASCRRVAKYGSAGHHQVGTGIEQGLVHHEILLLASE